MATDIVSTHPIVDAASELVALVLVLYNEPSKGRPTLKHPLLLLVAKLLAHRIGIQVPDDVRQFELVEWLNAHRDDDDPVATGANFDASRLRKSVVDFYKDAPKSLIIPTWLSNFKNIKGVEFWQCQIR